MPDKCPALVLNICILKIDSKEEENEKTFADRKSVV